MNPAATHTDAGPFQLVANIEIQASAADASKPAKADILAYTGGAMRVGWESPVVLDLAGIQLPGSIPILADHQNRVDAILGSGRPFVSGNELRVQAVLARTPATLHLIELAKAGVVLQASVGVDPAETAFVRAGESVKVNGRDHAGPIYVARKSVLRETSIVAIGADSGSRTAIKARGGKASMDKDSPIVAGDELAQERQRIDDIDRIVAEQKDQIGTETARTIRAMAIDNKLTAQAAQSLVNAAALDRLRMSRGTDAPSGFAEQRGYGGDSSRNTIAAAALVACGAPDVAAKYIGEREADLGIKAGVTGIYDLAMLALRLEGGNTHHGGREATIKAAFSTTSLPIALGDSIAKQALDAYAQTPAMWRGFARRVPLNDFREQTAIRLDARNQRLEQVPATGELKHLKLGEQLIGKIRLNTHGQVVGVSRKDIINDDLSMFAGLPREMAVNAAETFADDFFQLLLTAPSTYFDASNNNVLTGSNSTLSIDSLAEAITKLRKQTAPNGRPISLQPAVLCVPPELEATARAILSSTELRRTTGGPTGNPVNGAAELAVEPRLSNSTFTGNSATAWYLFAGPLAAPMMAGFLNGRDTPVVEQVEMGGDVLGMGWRVYMDYGVSLGDYRAAVRSAGA